MARDHELWLQETSSAPHRGWTYYGDGSVRHECMAWLPEGMVEHKVLGFVSNHGGTLVESTPERLRVQLPLQIENERRRARRFRKPEETVLFIEVQLHRDTVCIKSMTHVTLHLRPVGPGAADDAVRRQCIEFAKDLRACLMAEHLERRFAERTEAEFPVEMWQIGDNGQLSVPEAKVDTLSRDMSATGIAVWVPDKPATTWLCIKYFDRASEDVVWATARVVRTAAVAGGRHLCAAHFDHIVRLPKWDERAALPHPKLESLFGEMDAAASREATRS